jgi:hypothetical protein
MGTPHVHCMSKLPTAHEPGERGAGAPGDRHQPDKAVRREEPVTRIRIPSERARQ